MTRGRLMLDAGSSSSCGYAFDSPERGTLSVPDMFFTAHGETVHRATLELEDGSHRTIDVTMGPRVGTATFSVAD